MAKRHSKKRGKAAKKPGKAMKMAAKAAVGKSATSRKKRMGKPGKKPGKKTGKRAAKAMHKHATMPAAANTIVIPIKTEPAMPADPANPLGLSIPAMPFGYGRDSIMNALVIMLILFAVLSAGIFYPQIKAPPQALPAPGTMQNK